jgi:hypothetical protein
MRICTDLCIDSWKSYGITVGSYLVKNCFFLLIFGLKSYWANIFGDTEHKFVLFANNGGFEKNHFRFIIFCDDGIPDSRKIFENTGLYKV